METLKHECGIALIRLRKPLSYYHEKYGTWRYGLNKMYLLMEKQHNRGQEGAGMACVKLNTPPGEEYFFRHRAQGSSAITEVFEDVRKDIDSTPEELFESIDSISKHVPFAGECYMGHLRYSTTGKRGMAFVHPMMRRSNWRAKSLLLCGNFNLTSTDKIFESITSVGQHPRNMSDTHIVIEQMGHALDREIERVYRIAKGMGLEGMDITDHIESHINLCNPLSKCSPLWEGGYAMCGMTGSGESFVMRDPAGIRPAFYYVDDEIVVVASERAVIQTVMNLTFDKVKELPRGSAITIDKSGEQVNIFEILPQAPNAACSFERIYFSRGSDRDIYKERKALGANLVPQVMKSIDYDLDHAVFSFIPNTAEVAYFGLVEGLNKVLNEQKLKAIQELSNPTSEELSTILNKRIRAEKVAVKDIKLRTFITQGESRKELAAHVYDITYGSLNRNEDKLVVIDDSIVRGTTLKESIITILHRLGPTKIVIVSSAPQVRYPDCYGIDMSRLEEFVAFRAAVALLEERSQTAVLDEIYSDIIKAEAENRLTEQNFVKRLYAPFSVDELNTKMLELLMPEGIDIPVELVFQSMEGLHEAVPNHPGDWYFSGNYPTKGGNVLVNRAYINFYKNR